MWADDSNAFAEIDLGTFDACDALSSAYAPGRGWVVVCATPAGARAQRLRDDGMTAWGHDGATLGIASAVGPATMVFDTSSSFLLLERARAVGGDRVLAFRFDDEARPLWPAPVEVNAFAPASADRLRATLAREGVVRVEGAAGKAVEIAPSGDLRSVGR
jgi:hypothetical protein